MGQKVNPIGLRVGYIRDWDSRWYAPHRTYGEWVLEDMKVRKMLRQRFAGDAGDRRPSRPGRSGGRGARDAGISRIEIERAPNLLKLTLHTARPGIIIGRGGRGVDEIRAEIEQIVKRKVHINVQEVSQPELDAVLVAENVAGQIERRVAFKRAVRQALQRSMKMGAKGIRVMVSGRLGGAEMSRRYSDRDGKIPLHTLRADIDYGATQARTASGHIGIKVWVYRGEVLPPAGVSPTTLDQVKLVAEKPRRGWRRVGAARKTEAETEEVVVAETPELAPELAGEQTEGSQTDAVEGEISEATQRAPEG
jgi:small subunit ribosomal protein S3